MKARTQQQGFGLVEIMVAITLGLLLTAAMVRMVLDTKENYTYSNTVARLQENGRFGLDLLTAEAPGTVSESSLRDHTGHGTPWLTAWSTNAITASASRTRPIGGVTPAGVPSV